MLGSEVTDLIRCGLCTVCVCVCVCMCECEVGELNRNDVSVSTIILWNCVRYQYQ
jgi:hypothetical protein